MTDPEVTLFSNYVVMFYPRMTTQREPVQLKG